MNVTGFIFARGGSKGVPRKNIRKLAGKPLINYSIETALASRFIDRVIVSTDDLEIAETAVEAGAEVPFMRPAKLAGDDSPEWLSWQHAIKEIRKSGHDFDLFAAIPATSPLREVQDIDKCIMCLAEDNTADAVITVCEAQRHPSFNMVTLDDNMCADLVLPGGEKIFRRQDASVIYDITTVAYVARPDFILNSESIFEGRVKAVVIPRERALDIDTEFDFKIAQFLVNDLKK